MVCLIPDRRAAPASSPFLRLFPSVQTASIVVANAVIAPTVPQALRFDDRTEYGEEVNAMKTFRTSACFSRLKSPHWSQTDVMLTIK